jgi:hypothetical protein
MSDELAKPGDATVRMARPMSVATDKIPTYRVSKAQSLRMRAYDKKVEAAEAKKAKKLHEAQTAKAKAE